MSKEYMAGIGTAAVTTLIPAAILSAKADHSHPLPGQLSPLREQTVLGLEFEVEHYRRPITDYFEQLTGTGFTVNHLLEPEMTEALLRNNPRFAVHTDNPIGLVFYCTKSS